MAAQPTARVKVHIYHEIREKLGRRWVDVRVPPGAGLRHLFAALAEQVDAQFESVGPTEESDWSVNLLVVNGTQVGWDDAVALQDGDEVYLIPPIAGG